MRPIFENTKGTLDWYCIDYWSRALSLDIAALKRIQRHQIALAAGIARDSSRRLRASGRRTVLVTNAHPEILAIKDAQLGIRRHFDAVHTSFTLGAPKESADFWPRLAGHRAVRRRSARCSSTTRRRCCTLRAAHGIEWVYAVRRPIRSGPVRAATEFPGVDSVHELAAGLAPH